MKVSEFADEVGAELAASLKRPEYRVALAVSAVAGAVCAQARLPFVPSLLASLLAAAAAERVYVVLDNLDRAALANLDAYAAIGAFDATSSQN